MTYAAFIFSNSIMTTVSIAYILFERISVISVLIIEELKEKKNSKDYFG